MGKVEPRKERGGSRIGGCVAVSISFPGLELPRRTGGGASRWPAGDSEVTY